MNLILWLGMCLSHLRKQEQKVYNEIIHAHRQVVNITITIYLGKGKIMSLQGRESIKISHQGYNL